VTFRSEADQLRTARRILNLRDDAERLEIEAAIARLRAETAEAIAASRPSIQSSLQKAMDAEYEADNAMVGSRPAHAWGE